ncbi:MAG: hypothetical protein A2283_22455 [Lentisphaerae bacterium RIFOXYA12_FULL_48_11]|nr:MAG: hypothetical protein A2283_22455 [Lentisphaerae bacterium RIFOXYA12_FULL_48_11]
MKVALLGLSQAGKRTLFTLLTGRHVPESRKEDECVEGHAPVRDPRVDTISAMVKPQKTKYADTVFSLCPDISEGSNERFWLETARRCELICMVVRSFSSDVVYHARGTVDPARDRANLETELMLADLELVEKRLERIGKEKRAGQNHLQVVEERTLQKCKQAIESEQKPGTLKLDQEENASLRSLGLLTLKPVIWAYNVDEKDVKDDGVDPVTISCKIEQEIMAIEDAEERKQFLEGLGLSSPGIDRMNRAVYDTLGLMSFYTMGADEVRAWTIRKGSVAPVAAGKIHTDIERGFIRVEIIKYDDLISAGSESAVKAQGKIQLKGKDYVIEDGDICNFRFNV